MKILLGWRLRGDLSWHVFYEDSSSIYSETFLTLYYFRLLICLFARNKRYTNTIFTCTFDEVEIERTNRHSPKLLIPIILGFKEFKAKKQYILGWVQQGNYSTSYYAVKRRDKNFVRLINPLHTGSCMRGKELFLSTTSLAGIIYTRECKSHFKKSTFIFIRYSSAAAIYLDRLE
jgi:hypothetical protein